MTSTGMKKKQEALSDSDKQAFATVLSRLDQLVDGATKLGVAYIGYKAANHWSGALTNLVALKLAQGGNLAGGVAGVSVLAFSGLTQIIPTTEQEQIDRYVNLRLPSGF